MRKRMLALALAVCLLVLPTLPAAQAAGGDTVTVSSIEDLARLAQSCTLDAWSRGKTVVLTADLDLSGTDFRPIPTFGGTFLGQGHTISGLLLTGDGSAQGLFRHIQPGGTVQDLTVTGLVSPAGSRTDVGGIAGVNDGTLQDCAFHGAVSGEQSVGGIAGYNGQTGQIIRCAVSGSVSGESATGGIAGRNLGLLLSCENSAGVNLAETDNSLRLEDLDFLSGRLSGTSPLDGSSDTGGIVGWSTGIVQSCTNTGSVGYPHVGYNVGGIAGRQSGYLSGCVNTGAIHGRKDVGGIVGQAEPYWVVNPGRDTLEQLRTELNTLNRLVNQALDNTQATGDRISARLTAMGTYTADARDSAKALLDRTTGFVDNNLDTVNTLLADLTGALDRLTPALDDLAETGDRLEELSRKLGEAFGLLGDASDMGDTVLSGLDGALASLRQGGGDLQTAAGALRTALDTLLSGGDSLSSVLANWRAARAALDRALSALQSASGSLDSALGSLQETIRDLGPLSGKLGEALDALEEAAGSAAEVGQLLRSVFRTVRDVSRDLTGDGPTQFTPLGEEVRSASDSLYEAMVGLSSEMEALHSAVDTGGDTLTADLRAISRQFNIVSTLLLDSLDGAREDWDAGLEGVFLDTSEEDIAAIREGKVSDCRNTGAVEGDRNVGGTAGAVAVELDLDPEDDTAGRFTFGATYETKAVLQDCVNQGQITAKKDCAGGIAGRMDLGTALGCENYGGVTSTGGSYVGGIAGLADASIRSCWGKSVLSGKTYIGGIAGWAGRLRDCCAIVTVQEGTEYLGAIAGGADEDSVIEGNRFVDMGLAGVDGVSYAGHAEPIPFDELCQLPEVPAGLTAFTLTLLAEGETVASIPFQYGEDLSRVELPEVPAAEGCYGVWPAFDTTGLRSDITLEAVYIPWVTLVPSQERSGQLALALAEGQFTEDAVLHVTDASPAAGVPADAAVWTVSLTGTAPLDTVPVRLLFPGKDATVQQYLDGAWTEVEAVRNGQYLLLTMTGTEGTFLLQSASGNGWFLPAIGGMAALAAAALAVRTAQKRKKKPVPVSK